MNTTDAFDLDVTDVVVDTTEEGYAERITFGTRCTQGGSVCD